MPPRLMLGVGLGCLALGVVLLAERLGFLARSEAAVGTVTATDATRYTLRFETDAGIVTMTRTLPVDKGERERLTVGRSVPLRYLRHEPQEARELGLGFWYVPLGLLAVGALGLAAHRYARR